ncbi:MAG: Uma2 family endonuclease [Cyanobacteria bacterium P01_A01_bin.105]
MTAALQIPNQPIYPLPKPVTVEQFIEWYPDISEYRYELRDGVIYQMPQPRGKHSQVGGAAAKRLVYAIDAAKFTYFIPRECLVKVKGDTAYEPDAVVLDESVLTEEPLWERASTVQYGKTIKLSIEVVSTNWQDDYEVKLAAYESLGIPEYWILDYAGLGGIRHIGRPKQPTLTICTLIDGEYEVVRLRDEAPITSMTFPDLNLTARDLLGRGE